LKKKLSPLSHKPSISNLFDDTVNLFEDNDDVIPNIPTPDTINTRDVADKTSNFNIPSPNFS
jgi:hypothetical protein